MDHIISMTRQELQDQLDQTSRLCERLTEAVKTLAHERDEARKQRDEAKDELGRAIEVVSAMGDHIEDKTETCSVCIKAYEKYQRGPVSSVEK